MAGRSVGPCSVVGGSVEDLLVGRWSVVGGWWADGSLVGGSVVGGLLVVDNLIIRLF